LKWQNSVFTAAKKSNEAAVHTSFFLSQTTVKLSKPFTDGECVKECTVKAREILLPEKNNFLELPVSLQT
jgi:hypothetical protein